MKRLLTMLLIFTLLYGISGNGLAENRTDNVKKGDNKSISDEGFLKADAPKAGSEAESTVNKDPLDIEKCIVLNDIQFQSVNSSILLDDGTFLIAGGADDAGICVLVDQQGNILHNYRIESPDSKRGAAVFGATRVGENIIAATYDYEIGTSFIALLNPDRPVVITERFGGHIDAVTPLDDGLLLCGSYFDRKKREIPWAAKIDEKGKYEWVFEGETNQLTAPGARKHFEFCAEYADGYVLLQHEERVYPDGNVYKMMKMTKDGSLVFSETIDLPKMEYGCLFTNVMVHNDTLILYGGVCNSDYQYVATVAAVDKAAKVLWIKEYTESVGVATVGNVQNLYYVSLVIRSPAEVAILVVDESGDIVETFANPFDEVLTDVGIRNIISDENGGLWIVGTIENWTHCFIAKFILR